MSLKFIDKNGQEVSIAGKGIAGKDGEGLHAGSILGYSGSREDVPEGYEVVDSNIFVSTDSLPIGTGMDYFGTTAPANYMFADGSAISRTEYAELFAVIGTTYGVGDGETTFNLPDKRSRVSIMKDNGTFNELGKFGGEEKHTLTTAEMPKHNHRVTSRVTSEGTDNGGQFMLAGFGNPTSGDNHYNLTVGTPGTVASIPTNAAVGTINTGSSAAHNILQPYLVCNYIIKVKNNNVDTAYDLIMADLGGAY